MVPSLVEAEVVLQTACLRPLSVDGLPIIGEVPGLTGVYVATGHWKKGILLSPVTARIIAELIVKGFMGWDVNSGHQSIHTASNPA